MSNNNNNRGSQKKNNASIAPDIKEKLGEEAARGKAAIEAGHAASGDNNDAAAKEKEKKDAAKWRSEG